MSHEPQGIPMSSTEAAPSSGVASLPSPPGSPTPCPPPPSKGWRRRLMLALLGGAALILGSYFGAPWLVHYFTHESTDDAYVNSHVSYISPRIAGNVVEVLVDDNQFVEPGMVLVRLDDQPYRIAVEQRRAALAHAKMQIDQQMAALQAAEAELEQARNQVRSQVTGLWGYWYLLRAIQNLVRYQEATLRANQATEELQKANLTLAQIEQARYAELAPRGAASKEMSDQKNAALRVAQEQVNAARAAVKQTQALLGISADGKESSSADLVETYPGVRYALSMAQQVLDTLGISFNLLNSRTSGILTQLNRLSLASLMEQAPAVQRAQARLQEARAALGGSAFNPSRPYEHPTVVQAQKELEQAELNLSYTVIKSPIAGYVNRRSVNPGNQVQAGQILMAVRPLHEVWIDANFKENQIANLRIGQAVDIFVDAYPGRVFHGRVAGFSPGTGAALSLLPPENATGNFVKVVQRLPVRIELTEPPPEDTPLFVGLSVVPEVDLKAPPTGPDAGKRLLGRSPGPRAAK
jgi:membrane fusion protein (multidrug efflux system)